jgi:GWxTD domain-containing protein
MRPAGYVYDRGGGRWGTVEVVMKLKRDTGWFPGGIIMVTVVMILASAAVSLSQGTSRDDSKTYSELGLPTLFADYASFKAKTIDKVKLEIYYKILPGALQFQLRGERYTASYELVLVIYDKQGRQLTGRTFQGEYSVDTYQETENIRSFTTNQAEFEIYSGEYRAELKLTDLTSGKSTIVELDINLSHFGYEVFALSDVEFAHDPGDSSGGVQFNKGDFRVIPSVARAYGEDFPKLTFYYEIYLPAGRLSPVEVAYEIHFSSQQVVASETVSVSPEAWLTPMLGQLDVADLAPGSYFLKIIASLKDRPESVEREFPFSISWSVLAMVKNDYDSAIEQLRYVATDKEKKALKEAKEVGERVRRWNQFWRSRDPTPGTVENELRDEYYSRIRYANLHFTYFGKEGWKTDFGMVYITYGPPEEIDRHPFDLDSRAYQIWYYYSLKRKFIFVDAGYGEYQLQYPYDGDLRKYR